MAGRYHTTFFQSISAESEIKLRIYQTYLEPWSRKVALLSRRIWVVDGFAGRGKYENGAPGSPAVALALSEVLAAAKSPVRLQCVFAETRQSNVQRLRELAGRYPSASSMFIRESFWDQIENVIRIVGREPALLFVDPFGLLAIDFERLVQLINGLHGPVDLVVNFRSTAAPRLVTDHRDRVTKAVGSADWEPDSISDVFKRNLAERCGFLRPASLGIRTRFGGAVKSELILASRHPDAYELWNDQIVLEAERLGEADGETDPKDSRDDNLLIVTARLTEWAAGRTRWRRNEVIAWHVVNHCGDAHTGTIKRAVGHLLRQGWKRAGSSPRIEEDFISWA